jgi:hypothetical protein
VSASSVQAGTGSWSTAPWVPPCVTALLIQKGNERGAHSAVAACVSRAEDGSSQTLQEDVAALYSTTAAQTPSST